jgi:hypothetical protein
VFLLLGLAGGLTSGCARHEVNTMSATSGKAEESGVVKAKELFESGKASRAQGNEEAAIRDFSAAVEALGTVYQSPAVIDDTGMKLTLARHEANLGHLPVAATLYERVMESRLARYDQLHPKPTE